MLDTLCIYELHSVQGYLDYKLVKTSPEIIYKIPVLSIQPIHDGSSVGTRLGPQTLESILRASETLHEI